MSPIDPIICPYCGSEETALFNDNLYDYASVDRDCMDCKKKYKVIYEITPKAIDTTE